MGKGSNYRPYDYKKMSKNFDKIFGTKKMWYDKKKSEKDKTEQKADVS